MDLPPLPLEVLREIEKIEQFAQASIARCWTPHALNVPKVIRLLCACATEVFDIEAKHYTSMAESSNQWLELIESNTRQVALGLCGHRGLGILTKQEYEAINSAVRKALDGRLQHWRVAIESKASPRQPIVEELEPKLMASKPFLRRASWLSERLRERAWDHNDPFRFGGPDRKTILKILTGESVKAETLEKLINALNKKKVVADINLLDIPTD